MELQGLTCLVTGANRGIGLAVARGLAREGARVLAGVRELDRYEPVDGAEPVQLDLSSRATIEAGVRSLPDVDVLVNNAGAFTAGLLEEQPLDDIYDVFQVNLVAPVQLTRAVLPGMLRRERGMVVLNSSVVAYVNMPGIATYSASKAGLSGFAEALRRELADTPVATLHVVTGGIDTEMLDEGKRRLRDNYGTAEHWDQHSPEEWGERIVEAIKDDKSTLGPGGKAALGKLASHLPQYVLDTVSSRAFDR